MRFAPNPTQAAALSRGRALEKFARRMKRKPTPAEAHLLKAIKTGTASTLPWVWEFQQPILNDYIADFYAPRALLVVEVDGSAHRGREAYDRKRDEAMAAIGIRTMRFTNDEVLTDVGAVIVHILAAYASRYIYHDHVPTPKPVKQPKPPKATLAEKSAAKDARRRKKQADRKAFNAQKRAILQPWETGYRRPA